MTCYFPLRLYRSTEGRNSVTGKWPLSSRGFIDKPVDVPCGKCIGCRLEYSRQWAIRATHELHTCDGSCFVTLTYDNEHIPWGGSHPTLVPKDLTLFLKRLRKDFGDGIRFLACGEYGSTTFRPHYHLCLFGVEFPDCVSAKIDSYTTRTTSVTLSRLWPYGFHDIGDVTFESAAYVARYVMDKQMGPDKDYFYESRGIEPEFLRMSRRPGLGKPWFDQFSSDVFPADTMIIRGGIKSRPPKYYSGKFELLDPIQYLSVKNSRKKFMIKNAPQNTLKKLRVREIIKIAQTKNLSRKKI